MRLRLAIWLHVTGTLAALDMVVVCTSALEDQLDGTGNHSERIHHLPAKYVLPAAHQ